MRAPVYSLKAEQDADFWEVEALFDLCFAPGREALSSYRLRDGVAPVAELSLVARDADGILAGAIRYWPVLVASEHARHNALLLGPIAVHPTRQGEGLGGVLIRDSMALATGHALSGNRVMLVGDAPYYSRFGFQRLNGVIMPPPTNPARLLGAALAPDAWQGVAGHVRPLAD